MLIPDPMRLVMPVEVVDIVRLQREPWSRQPGMAAVFATIPADQAVRVRHGVTVKPPLVHCRMLITLPRRRVVGLVVTGLSNDSDAEVTDGMVAEFVTNADVLDGHASHLASAVVDTLRADGYEAAT